MVALGALSVYYHIKQPQRLASCDSHSNSNRPRTLEELYQLQEVLGKGAFAQVYRAKRKRRPSKSFTEIEMVEEVAIKVVHTKGSDELEDFQREFNALNILSTPGNDHVCRLYDKHQDNHGFYLAMELINGSDILDHLNDEGSFGEKDASKLMEQLSDALCYIHSKGLIHGDLKPENLMLTSEDSTEAQLKVVDFGSSSSIVSKHPASAPRTITIVYSPPEVQAAIAQNEPYVPSTPARDMFGTGCILYILLTGIHPFDNTTGGASEEEIAEAIRNHSGEFKEHPNVSLSKSARDVISKLLHPDPQQRMTSQELQQHSWVQRFSEKL